VDEPTERCPKGHDDLPDAKFCSTCGAALSGDNSATKTANANKKAGIGCLVLFLLVGGGCAAMVALGGDDNSSVTSDGGQEVSEARFGAFDVCKEFVGDRLKAPGSATWRNPTGDQVSYVGDGVGPITVSASVDAQNSFGAEVRTDYSCTVTRVGDRWRLDSLTGV
jgi:hypothetical protein